MEPRQQTDNQDDFEYDLPAGELDYQPHITDDPNVWGLLDVATGRRSEVPQTIYRTSGDSASGVAGILMANGEFIPKRSSNIDGRELEIGLLHDVKPAPREATVTYVTAWDGAKPAAEFINEDGEPAQEHSHGILLADYQIRGRSSSQKVERRHILEEAA